MFTLNLPFSQIKIKEEGTKKYIFDSIRRKYVILTPEEWVRQQFLAHLIRDKGYPATLISNEMLLTTDRMKRRCDTVIFNRNLEPLMILEYKAPSVPITQKVFDQIVRYNTFLKVAYLIVSNGLKHYCCHVDIQQQKVSFLKEIPNYTELLIDLNHS